jgi:hypothetical protein
MSGVISHSDFRRDLKRGVVGEEVVEEFIKKEFGVALKQSVGANKFWDFEVIDGILAPKKSKRGKDKTKDFKSIFGSTIEVKYDEAAARYGRFFIELMFDVDSGKAGAATACKADTVVWVIPSGKGKYQLYFFRRPEFLSWLILYILDTKGLKLKTPGISPKARGLPVSIQDAIDGFAFIEQYEFKF